MFTLQKTAIALGTAGLLAVGGGVFAQTASSTTPSMPERPAIHAEKPMIVTINPNGKVLLRGKVVSTSTTTMTVASWGGNWIVTISPTTDISPRDTGIGSIKQGDIVGVQGTIDQNANWTIHATLVRDWTERQTIHQEVKENIKSVHEEMKAETPKTHQGTVSNLSGQAFTLTTENAAYSVSLTANAKILAKNWHTLDWSKVQNGDTVRVWGPISSSTISASIFRDLSVSR